MARTGLFWVIAKDPDEIAEGNFKIISSINPCGINKLNSQRQVWLELVKNRPQLQRYPFWQFPRGRVELLKTANKTSYILTISKALATPTVIESVKSIFGLTYDHLKIRKDSSGEYDCIFDYNDQEEE